MSCFKVEHIVVGKSASHPHRPWPGGSGYECAKCMDKCVFFCVLCKGELRPIFQDYFLFKNHELPEKFRNSSIRIQKGIVLLLWGGAGRTLRHSA